MLTFTVKRFFLALLVAITVSVVTFTLLRLTGDIAAEMAGEDASAADIADIRRLYGLDRPLYVQYFEWALGAVKGDLGESLYFRQPVRELVAGRMRVTMTLGACALAFALVLSIPLGVLAALRPNTWIDRLALTTSVFGQALPAFWFALMMMILFGVILRWLPISGSETWKHFVIPTIALGYYGTPAFMRLTRAGMMEVLASDFIRTARAKGLDSLSVLFKHALRNAIIPVVSLAAVQLGFLLGGSVIMESIFSLHGLGYLAYESILRSDVAVVQAVVLIFSLFYIVLTFLADLLNGFLDPRIRVG
jgi:peptide/nickel transport system permease protein